MPSCTANFRRTFLFEGQRVVGGEDLDEGRQSGPHRPLPHFRPVDEFGVGEKVAHRFDASPSSANRMAHEILKSGRRRAPRPRAVPEQDERMLAPHANKTPDDLAGSRSGELSTA